MSRQLKRIPIAEPKKLRPPPGKQAQAKRETGSAGPATSDIPSGRYTDYNLLSSKHSDKKWDVFRLQTHSEVPIDLNVWPQPVKLNRKDYKSPNEIEEQAGPLTPMLGPDGKPVIGPDGKIVMLNADGTRVKKEEDTKGKKKGKEDPKKKAFMKKTRQVHMIPDEVRAFRKEHRKDWLLEDNGGGLAANQSWSGKYADSNDKRIWAFFAPVPGNEKEFRFIPVHRFYNFTRNNNVNTERVENQHARMQAAKTSAKTKPKKEEEDEKPARGGRRLKVVNHGNDLFGGDEESKPRLGGEGDDDEMEYEDEVQDDEEVPAEAIQDEEEKEAAERQKREYRRDKVSERVEPESDEEEDDGKGYTEDGRQIKKLMKKMLNESDDEKNPYADSDDEEEDEEKPEPPQATGVMPNTPTPAQSQSGTSTPRPQGTQPAQPASQVQKLATGASAPANVSRSGSPSMGGAALLAQRATSPHPIRKSPSVGSNVSNNRATTPLSSAVPPPGSGGSANGKKRKDRPSDRGGTPTPPQKRPTPTPQTPPGGRASTPTGMNGQKKKKSKHDLVAPNGDPLPEVITEQHAIEYLRKMGGAVQTSECITYFKRALKHDPENQRRLTDALKKVSTQAQKGYIKLNAPWA